MRKDKMARSDTRKLTRSKLGRTVFRPLSLPELTQVTGGTDDAPASNAVEGDGIQY